MSNIYGTSKGYDRFWIWMAKKMPAYLDYFYLVQYNDDETNELIASFPEEADKWLLGNCTLDWVIEQIKK